MSTQIVDNFQLNVAKPIDSRMVTYGTASRNSLQFIYEGLRVYDVVNKAPYVYINSGWQQESSSGAISGGGGGGSVTAGTTNRLVKYATSTTIGDSAILDRGTYASPNIGIGKIPAVGSALDVNGRINANTLNVSTTITATNFVGELNGSYISVKSLSIDKIVAGLDNQVLKTIGTGNNATVTWVNDNNTTIAISNETSSANTHYLLFSNSSSGSVSLNTNNGTSRLIGVKPSTSQLLASADVTTNSQSAPGYAFSGTTTAGLYGNTTEIGLSFNSTALLKLDTTKLSILDTSGTTVLSSGTGLVNFGSGALIKSQAASSFSSSSPDYTWQGDSSTGIYRPSLREIGFSANGTRKLIINQTKNEFFGGLTINGRIDTTGIPTDSYINGGGLIIDGSGAGLNVNGLVSVRDFHTLVSFKFEQYNGVTPAIGDVLTATDTDGSGAWKKPESVPYGTIIMWLSTTIPSGWRICGSYNTGTGANNQKALFVFIEGEYVRVPVLVDKVIMGGTTVTGGGNVSPKSAHTSGVRAILNGTGQYNYTQIGSPSSNTYSYRGVREVGAVGKPTGLLTSWGSPNATLYDDNDRGMLLTNTGVTKYQELIFIIKINENAGDNEPGHFKIEVVADEAYDNNQYQVYDPDSQFN